MIKLWTLTLLLLLSCQGKQPYDDSFGRIEKYNEETKETSLIEHPFIFEKLGLKLDGLTYKKIDSFTTITATFTGNIELYSEECYVYFHAYKENELFLNMDLRTIKTTNKNQLKFSKTLQAPKMSIQEIRFGLTCLQNEGRYFTLTLNEVRFS